MFRNACRGVTTAILALTAIAFAPHAYGRPGDLNLWPMKKGNSWTLVTTVLDTASNKKTVMNQVLTVTDLKPVAGGEDATIEYKMAGKLTQIEKFHITDAGMFKTSGGADGNGAVNPPLAQFKYPVKVGSSWTWKGTIGTPAGTVPSSAAYSLPRMEPLNVLGQTVKAYKYHLNLTVLAGGQKSEFINDSWYAPNMGLVKQHLAFGKVNIDCTLTKYAAAK